MARVIFTLHGMSNAHWACGGGFSVIPEEVSISQRNAQSIWIRSCAEFCRCLAIRILFTPFLSFAKANGVRKECTIGDVSGGIHPSGYEVARSHHEQEQTRSGGHQLAIFIITWHPVDYLLEVDSIVQPPAMYPITRFLTHYWHTVANVVRPHLISVRKVWHGQLLGITKSKQSSDILPVKTGACTEGIWCPERYGLISKPGWFWQGGITAVRLQKLE